MTHYKYGLYDLVQKVEKEQKKFKSDLNEITRVDPKHKSKDQLHTIKNVNNLHDLRQKNIDLLNYYAKKLNQKLFMKQNNMKQNRTKQWDEPEQWAIRLKILTPKQLFQRLPIALAQVKADNNAENLLKKIRQIVYFFYQSKEIAKKVYNNIIKPIQI